MGVTAIKAAAMSLGIRVCQPENINTPESLSMLRELKPDLFVIIAYGQIFSREALDIPMILSVNSHASLLPAYRGAAPINWALINGEEKTGVTIMKVTRKMDSGPVILQREIPIEDADTVVTVEKKLADMGADILLEAVTRIENHSYSLCEQDELKATVAQKLKKEHGLIYWDNPAGKIHNLVRGVLDWPGAFTHYRGKQLKIFKTTILPSVQDSSVNTPGEILSVSKNGIVVAAGEGALCVEELQLEGRRKMSAAEFISGHKIAAGEFFEQIHSDGK